jgi:hypothetical protein
MATAELSRLAWYKEASANLKSYLAELEANKAALTERDSHATDQIDRRNQTSPRPTRRTAGANRALKASLRPNKETAAPAAGGGGAAASSASQPARHLKASSSGGTRSQRQRRRRFSP